MSARPRPRPPPPPSFSTATPRRTPPPTRSSAATSPQHDDPRGPWETLLLDRVVSLAWRLQRIPKVERGLLTQATLGLSWARASRRLREAHAPDLGRLGVDGAALATNPHRLAQSVQSVRTLRAAIAE